MGYGDKRLLDALPMLRRYARGLVGSSSMGDRLIEQCLCAYCDGHFSVDLTRPALGLFRLFHDHLAKERLRQQPILGLPRRPSDLPVAVLILPQGERVAVLLTRTMGFTYAEAAEIVRLPETEVRRRTLSGMRRLVRLTSRGAAPPVTYYGQSASAASLQ